MTSRPRHLALAGALMLVLAGAALAAVLSSGSGGGADPASPTSSSVGARFTALSAAHSNRCSLQAPQVMAMPNQARLRGSCCFPMDATSYARQIHELRRYSSVRDLVPSDPYDVSVALVKRLLAYRNIPLSAGERHAYTVAIHRSETHGPCCCPCWRWQAFKGQARYLLHRRHYSGSRVGRLWTLEEGCGGPSDQRT